MNGAWFKRFGWFHFPISIPGAVVVLAAMLFCANVFSQLTGIRTR